jgi:hypothetical protein
MKPLIIALTVSVSLLATQAGSEKGRAGAMPAYYDGELFTINFKEMGDKAADALRAHNGSINVIYMSDATLADGSMFVAMLDAIQGDGFNPLWVEVDVTFNSGFQPRQLLSDVDIDDAEASGEITLTVTDEVYRCSVIGPK